jgi:hypothetical protein
MTAVAQFNPQLLKNRGVPVRVHNLAPDGAGGFIRQFGPDGEPVEAVQVSLLMTNDVLSDLEDDLLGWGSLDAWQKAMQSKPFQTLGKTLALILGWFDAAGRPDYRRAGKAMLDGEVSAYSVAMSSAFALANGADPTKASEQLLKQLAQVERQRVEQAAAIDAQLDAVDLEPATPTPPVLADTPGSSGVETGASSAALLTSSGV